MRQIACGDCVVSVLLEIKPTPEKNAEFSNCDKAAISNLASVGLVPPLRFKPASKSGASRKKTG